MQRCAYCSCTVYAEIFVGEIFFGLNFSGIKFSWLKPPMKIGRHENFATLTVCSMERWLVSSEYMRGYHVCNNIWEAAVGQTLVWINAVKRS